MSTNGNGHNAAARLRALEVMWRASQTCQTCYGHPSRLTYADPQTGTVWYETMPPTGCPDCGTLPQGREHRLYLPDDGTGGPPAMFRRGSAPEGTA